MKQDICFVMFLLAGTSWNCVLSADVFRHTFFKRETGVLYKSTNNFIDCKAPDGKCRMMDCLRACVNMEVCDSFSHNPSSGECMVNLDSSVTSESNSTWNTFVHSKLNLECLPPFTSYTLDQGSEVCLSFNDILMKQAEAESLCQTQGGKLVIVDNMGIWNLLKQQLAGGTYTSMFYLFRIPESTLGYLIPEVCQAIYDALKDEYLKVPSTEEEWQEVQAKFLHKWDFPQCLGAVDGKHVAIQCPNNTGSRYFNYLRFFSIVLFAMVDANYKFLYFEVGCEGRVGDATIWNNSPLKQRLETGQLMTPPPQATPGGNVQVPSIVVGDAAFALSQFMMKPYPDRNITREQRVFNYRLSRARRIVENAFGILASRFGVYQTAMKISPQKAKVIVLATLALHNFLRAKKDQQYLGAGAVDFERGDNHEVIPGNWRANQHAHMQGLQPAVGGARNDQYLQGRAVRDGLKDYFGGPGSVPWQNARV